MEFASSSTVRSAFLSRLRTVRAHVVLRILSIHTLQCSFACYLSQPQRPVRPYLSHAPVAEEKLPPGEIFLLITSLEAHYWQSCEDLSL